VAVDASLLRELLHAARNGARRVMSTNTPSGTPLLNFILKILIRLRATYCLQDYSGRAAMLAKTDTKINVGWIRDLRISSHEFFVRHEIKGHHNRKAVFVYLLLLNGLKERSREQISAVDMKGSNFYLLCSVVILLSWKERGISRVKG